MGLLHHEGGGMRTDASDRAAAVMITVGSLAVWGLTNRMRSSLWLQDLLAGPVGGILLYLIGLGLYLILGLRPVPTPGVPRRTLPGKRPLPGLVTRSASGADISPVCGASAVARWDGMSVGVWNRSSREHGHRAGGRARGWCPSRSVSLVLTVGRRDGRRGPPGRPLGGG
jgi:hypothetical protein